jgi:hypothetical protein
MLFTWLVLLLGLSIGVTGALSAKLRIRLLRRPGDNGVGLCCGVFDVNYEVNDLASWFNAFNWQSIRASTSQAHSTH